MSYTTGKKIAKNTVLLYARMAIVMVINLYTVRLVLNALGAEDYGIYDVVAGIVVMLQSFSGVLSISTQRFYSYALGEPNYTKLSEIFTASINIFTVFSIIVLLLSETVGLWFLNTNLEIPDSRMNASNWIYQFSVFSFIALIMQTPFSAAVIANEDMGYFSLISILECVLRFVTAFFIAHTAGDRLIYYGLLLMLITMLSLVIYIFITTRKYNCFKYSLRNNASWRELLTFSSWTFVSSVAGVMMTQVCTILVNIFFGPIVNAARAIAFQMYNVVNSFCSSFLMAVRPPMVKSYAERDYDYLNELFMYSTKFTFYTLLILFIPMILEMKAILNLWLGTSDAQTILFSRLMLIYSLLLAVSNPITFIMHASGFVKEYHLRVEIPTLLIMPVTYILYLLGMPAYSTYVVMIIAVSASHLIRLYCLKLYYPQYDITLYFTGFIVRAVAVSLLSFIVIIVMQAFINDNLVRLVSIIITTLIAIPLVTYGIGLDNREKHAIKIYMSAIIKKLTSR